MSALVRPLIWLFIFAAGFRQTLGVSIIPPYETYVLYEVYVVPGLLGMILLFNAMQSSLSMVYDRETGAMRTLLVSPFPRSFLLISKLIGGVAVAAIQAYVFLAIFYFWEAELSGWGYPLLLATPALLVALIMFNSATEKLSERFMQNALIVAAVVELAAIAYVIYAWKLPPPSMNYLTVAPALVLSGLMLGSLALFMSSVIKQLENFAGVMNFVIFPMFFASSALYPLWRVKEFEPAALPDLPAQSVHPRGGADPLRPLRPGRLAVARHRRGLHRGVPRRSHLCLQPIERPDRTYEAVPARELETC